MKNIFEVERENYDGEDKSPETPQSGEDGV